MRSGAIIRPPQIGTPVAEKPFPLKAYPAKTSHTSPNLRVSAPPREISSNTSFNSALNSVLAVSARDFSVVRISFGSFAFVAAFATSSALISPDAPFVAFMRRTSSCPTTSAARVGILVVVCGAISCCGAMFGCVPLGCTLPTLPTFLVPGKFMNCGWLPSPIPCGPPIVCYAP